MWKSSTEKGEFIQLFHLDQRISLGLSLLPTHKERLRLRKIPFFPSLSATEIPAPESQSFLLLTEPQKASGKVKAYPLGGVIQTLCSLGGWRDWLGGDRVGKEEITGGG